MPTPTTQRRTPGRYAGQAGRELGRHREDGQEDREAELGLSRERIESRGLHLHSHRHEEHRNKQVGDRPDALLDGRAPVRLGQDEAGREGADDGGQPDQVGQRGQPHREHQRVHDQRAAGAEPADPCDEDRRQAESEEDGRHQKDHGFAGQEGH